MGDSADQTIFQESFPNGTKEMGGSDDSTEIKLGIINERSHDSENLSRVSSFDTYVESLFHIN